MPLALLLQKLTTMLAAAAKTLTPWLQIVSFESTVVERARSAFLVHWFGPRLPFAGLNLRAHIVNVDALNARFLTAQRSVPTSQGGPNLTSPVLGFAGTLAGVLLSPVGAITGASLLLRFSGFSLKTILEALAWVVLPALLGFGLVVAPTGTGILVGGGLAGAGLAFAVSAAVGDRREVRAVFDLFGSLARFMNAGADFLEQLAGPRAAVRNPLLRDLLRLGDRVAAVFARVIGAVAVVATRIGPVLPSVATTVVGLRDLAGSTVAALGEVVSGLLTRLDEATSGRLSISRVLHRVVGVAQRQLGVVREALLTQFDVLVGAMAATGSALGAALDAFGDAVGDFVGGLFTDHPTVQVMDALTKEIDVIAGAFAAPPPPGTPKPKAGPSALAPLVAALPALPPFPTFPTPPSLPGTRAQALLRWGLGGHDVPALDLDSITAAADRFALTSGPEPRIELSRAATAAVDRVGRGPSVFLPERRAAEAEFGGPLPAALRLNRAQLQQFRDTLGVVVGRILPPEMRATAVPALATVLAKLDHAVYGEPERTVHADALPVLDVPTTDRIRPVVKVLRLRLPGAAVGQARRFEDLLTRRLRSATYTTGER